MNRAKVLAFFQEFPFLGNILDENDVRYAYVRRVDRGLLAKKSERHEDDPECFSGHSVWDVYMLLDGGGFLLATVDGPTRKKWWRPATWGKKRFGETVGDAIARLGDWAEEVFFVVHFVPVMEVDGGTLTLYKLPKSFTLKGWLEEELRREQAVIRAESEAIDVLADQK